MVPLPGDNLRFDFETWLTQTYGLKARDMTRRELSIARKEYAEEYPKPGNTAIKLKTYPFKMYLDAKDR